MSIFGISAYWLRSSTNPTNLIANAGSNLSSIIHGLPVLNFFNPNTISQLPTNSIASRIVQNLLNTPVIGPFIHNPGIFIVASSISFILLTPYLNHRLGLNMEN
jgi:hypothetical protein